MIRYLEALIAVLMLTQSNTVPAEQALEPAEPPEPPGRTQARSLGERGIAAYQLGQYPSAVDKLEQAYALFKVPVLGLWLGRSLARVDRLVEASKIYAEVVRLDPSMGESEGAGKIQREVQVKAQTDAATELESLSPRVPSITMKLTGAKPSEVEVTLDGKSTELEQLNVAIPVDPGSHEIVANWGASTQSRELQLAEGQHKEVVLRFSVRHAALVPAASVVAAPTPHTAVPIPPPQADAGADGNMGNRELARWISLGVGSAGVLAGGISGLVAFNRWKSIEDDCPNNQCGAEQANDIDFVNQWRMVSMVSLAVGTVGLGVGGGLWLTEPQSRATASGGRLYLSVGAGSVSVGGRL